MEPWCSQKSQLCLKKTEEKHKALCPLKAVSVDSMTARRKVTSGWDSLWEAGVLKGPTELEVGNGGAQKAKNGSVRSRWTGVSDGASGFCSRAE